MKRTVKHNNLECIFDSDMHSYIVDNVFLESVTSYKKSFFPEFDMQKQAEIYARKNAVSAKSVLKNWKHKGLVGRTKGQTLHTYAEKLLQKVPFDYTTYGEYIPVLKKLTFQLLNKFEVFGIEYIVFSLNLKLAGTLDAILIAGNRVMLLDWKTDKAIKTSNSWDRAYHPFSSLDACNFNEYAVQLNLYQYIIKEENYFPKQTIFMKRIVHLTDNKAIWYKIPDLQPQIKKIFS